MRLALVQMYSEKGEVDYNLGRMAGYVDRAQHAGADLVCFPEMSVTGYVDPSRQPAALLKWDDPSLEPLFDLSRASKTAVIAGIAERGLAQTKPFISQGVMQDGALFGVYRKINLAEDEVDDFASGSELLVRRVGGMGVGIAVCADIESDALFRDYAERGARLVLLPSAPGLDGPQETRDWRAGFEWWREKCKAQLGEYARKYGIFIGVATQAGRTVDEDFPGGGYLFDRRGELVAETSDRSERILVVDIADQPFFCVAPPALAPRREPEARSRLSRPVRFAQSDEA